MVWPIRSGSGPPRHQHRRHRAVERAIKGMQQARRAERAAEAWGFVRGMARGDPGHECRQVARKPLDLRPSVETGKAEIQRRSTLVIRLGVGVLPASG